MQLTLRDGLLLVPVNESHLTHQATTLTFHATRFTPPLSYDVHNCTITLEGSY
jgi:hypothetical protein